MTIYALVFFILLGLIGLLGLLLFPLPTLVRKKLVFTLKENQRIRTIAAVVFVLLACFFYIDLKESFKFSGRVREKQLQVSHGHGHSHAPHAHLQELYFEQTQYFRNLRNLYLSGFTLTMILINIRVVYVLSDFLKEQDKAGATLSQAKNQQKEYDRLNGEKVKIEKDLQGLKDKDTEIKRALASETALKSQASQLQKAYADLVDRNKELEDRISTLTAKNSVLKKAE